MRRGTYADVLAQGGQVFAERRVRFHLYLGAKMCRHIIVNLGRIDEKDCVFGSDNCVGKEH